MQIIIETRSRDARIIKIRYNSGLHGNSSLVSVQRIFLFLLWKFSSVHICGENSLWNSVNLLFTLNGCHHMYSLPHASLIVFFFFFLIYFIYLFIFGCAGSLFLCEGFL